MQLRAFSHINGLPPVPLYRAMFMRTIGGREEGKTLLLQKNVFVKFVCLALISKIFPLRVLCLTFWVNIPNSSKFLVAFLIFKSIFYFLMVGTYMKACFIMCMMPKCTVKARIYSNSFCFLYYPTLICLSQI